MSSRIRRLTDPGTLAMVCVLVLGAAFVIQPQFDPDYWWHVLVGDKILHGSFPRTDPFTFTAQGHEFVVHEWLSEALLAALSHLGMWAVITVFALVTAGGATFGLVRARRVTGSNAVLAVVAAIGLAVSRTVFGPRPQMFTFAFIAGLLWVLDRHRRRPEVTSGRRLVWWLVPMFALWGNLHGGFVIGLGLFVVVIVGDAVSTLAGEPRAVSPRRLRTMAMVLVAATAALVINPNGVGVYRYAAGLLSNGAAQASLDEWRSPDFHDPDFIPLALLIALLILVAPRARRVDLADVLVAAAGVVLTLYAVRNLSTIVITTAPLLADGLDGWRATIVERFGRGDEPNGAPSAGLAVPFACVVLATVVAVTAGLSARSFADERNNDRSAAYPVPVADALCAGPRARVFQPYGSAGWLLYEWRRETQRPCSNDAVFIFGEVRVMGPALFQEYLDAAAGRADTAGILNSHRVDAVWQLRGSALAHWLATSETWRCVWGDARNVIYARAGHERFWPARGAGCGAAAPG